MKRVLILLFFICLTHGQAKASIIDTPHNETNNIACTDCHNYSLWWQFSPVLSDPQLRETTTNTICLTCHGDSGPQITVKTHSSATMGNAHRPELGDWSRACVDCHDPHFQAQLNWKGVVPDSDLYLVTGAMVSGSLSVTGDGTKSSPYYSTFKYQNLVTKPGWDNATTPWTAKEGTAGRGLILSLPLATSDNTYEITAVNETQSQVTVRGKIDSSYADSDTQFGLIYGQLIRNQINVYGKMSNVKFFDPKGGFVHIGDNDGICQVCHTKTRHFRNTGEINASTDGYDHTSQVSATCTKCHPHDKAFSHGGGGTGCVQCHGHDAGTIYDPDMSKTDPPYVPNSEGLASIGAGTFQSHSTHTEFDSDDQRGPQIYCGTCHDINNMPKFKNQDGSGNHTLTETDICNSCHSPGGTYDGVNDPVIGAKANWHDGIYDSSGNLKPGKDKWCAGCHDEEPSVIKGIPAPNVIGDESGEYTYGKGWGFYKTGHGLEADKEFPSNGGVSVLSGRPVNCNSCHDFTTKHIFGVKRPYNDNDSSSTDPSVYREAYRLQLVDPGTGSGASSREPLHIPLPKGAPNIPNNFRLCFKCHDPGPFMDSTNMNTNLVTGGVNRHYAHLAMNYNLLYPADWNGSNNSQTTCITCHNVHGSTRLAMVRDGKLIGRTPGLEIWYNNDNIVHSGGTSPPQPEDLPLSASTGTVWINLSTRNLCVSCHGDGNTEVTYRTPYQDVAQAPTLDWTGETGYEADGASPETAASGSNFTFRVKYTDANNDAPSPVELWIDQNNNGIYEAGEKYAMTAVDGTDTNYTNGVLYTKTLSVNNSASNIISYRFYASDGTSAATGPAIAGGSITLLNNAPTLSWTGETGYTADGVSPDTGGNGTDFVFRVNYTDADNNAPASIQIWVDAYDNGTYEAEEKHNMTAVDSNDTTYSDGKSYSLTLPLAFAGDGAINYRFYASDGPADATGSPTTNSTLNILSTASTPPTLDWMTGTCRAEGVKPALGSGGGDFNFLVKYTDQNNQCPTANNIQVWVDENNNGVYDAGEKHDLSEVDSNDTNCADGKLYTLTRQISLVGTNDQDDLNYRFYASNGTDSAVGTPTSNHTLTVVNAYKVRPDGGDGWYSSIQDAINASTSAHTILVYEGTYNENLLFTSSHNNTTVRSVCGPDSTTIQGNGATYAAYFLYNSGSTMDGFQIIGGANTAVYLNSATSTIANCKIHDSARGIFDNSGTATIDGCDIYSNSADSGSAVFLNGGSNHVIKDSTFHNNIATNASTGGGALFVQNTSATVTASKFEDNTASAKNGGAVFLNSGHLYSSSCSFTNNNAAAYGGAIALGNSYSSAELTNDIIARNQAVLGGGAIYTNGGPVTLTNTTVVDNKATAGKGGAITAPAAASSVTAKNSILWGNQASTSGHFAYFNYGCSLTLTDIVMNNDGDGDFGDSPYIDGHATVSVSGYQSENDPFFVNEAGGDYHLTAASDAIDHADTTAAPANDFEGNTRPQGEASDIGAYEYVK